MARGGPGSPGGSTHLTGRGRERDAGAWRCLGFSVAGSAIDDLSAILHENGSIGIEERDGRLFAYFPEPVDLDALMAAVRAGMGEATGLPSLESSTLVTDGHWHERWVQGLSPIEAGKRFVILPGDVPPAGLGTRTPIRLVPGRAFGTGEHETTRMCIELLERSLGPGDTLLDVGTGSGILAIAACFLGASPILAIDLDEEAVAIAAQNARANRAREILFAACGLEALAPRVSHVVVANLYGATLLRQMGEIGRRAARDLVISGFTREEEPRIVASAEEQAMRPQERLCREGWVAVLCRRDDGS